MKTSGRFFLTAWIFLLLVGVVLFIWSLQTVPFDQTLLVLTSLDAWEIAALLAINTAILLIAPWRWWLILRAQGHPVAYLALFRYRLAGSAVSYFTPGQNFGGEPLQVISLRKHHQVPGSAALASVTLDRAVELFVNFTVLALGIVLVISTGLLTDLELRTPLVIALLVLAAPVAYLVALRLGARPLGNMLKRLEGGLVKGVRNAEEQIGELARRKPHLFVQGLLATVVVWAGLFYEFWLALDFLGLRLDALQLVLVVTAGRIALLAPTPGALGALEASQMLAVQALGFDPAIGLSLGLLIRARDILFAVIGLAAGGFILR